MKFKLLSTALATVMMTGLALDAHAARLSSYVELNTSNLFQDESMEAIVDVNNDNYISVGDVFMGVLRLDGRTSPQPGQDVNPDGDLSIVFAIEVATLSADAITWKGSTVDGLTLSDLTTLTAGQIAGTRVSGDAVGALYSNVNFDPIIDTSAIEIDQILSNIDSVGTLELVVGLADNSNDFFQGARDSGTGPFSLIDLPLNQLSTVGVGSIITQFGAGLTMLTNESGVAFDPTACAGNPAFGLCNADVGVLNGTLHDLAIVGGELTGAGGDNAGDLKGQVFGSISIPNPSGAEGNVTRSYYGFTNNADFRVEPVPEPGVLALLGLGLIGFAVRGTKRSVS